MKNFKIINDVVIFNTTPHKINFLVDDDTVVEIDSDPAFIVNAKAVEKKVDDLFVTTVFNGTDEGKTIIDSINDFASESFPDKHCVIVGSMIAAQSYPEKVVAMVPAKGFERVPPNEKKMNPRKFTVFPKQA